MARKSRGMKSVMRESAVSGEWRDMEWNTRATLAVTRGSGGRDNTSFLVAGGGGGGGGGCSSPFFSKYHLFILSRSFLIVTVFETCMLAVECLLQSIME